MESELSGQNIAIGASSQDFSEIKASSILKETELSSQNSGAILKTVAKTKSGGVKLGSFRLGGRKKTNSEEDSGFEVKEVKKKSKKSKKEKGCDDSDKQDSEGSSVSTPSPGSKQSIPGKASSLVRKLSIGKYKASGSRKTLKSPDTPSSQEEYQSVSTEEEIFVTQSPPSSAMNGHSSVEVNTTPGQDAAGPLGQGPVTKGNITDSFTQTTPANTDPLPVSESTSRHEIDEIVSGQEGSMIVGEAILPTTATNSDSDNLAAVRACALESAHSGNGVIVLPAECSESIVATPVCTIPPRAEEEDKTPEHVWGTQPSGDEGVSREDGDKKARPKDRLLALTALMTPEQRKEVEEYQNRLRSMCEEAQKRAEMRPDLYGDFGIFPSARDRRQRSGSSDMLPVMLLHSVKMSVSGGFDSSHTSFLLLCLSAKFGILGGVTVKFVCLFNEFNLFLWCASYCAKFLQFLSQLKCFFIYHNLIHYNML
jgi:hypothetical protein